MFYLTHLCGDSDNCVQRLLFCTQRRMARMKRKLAILTIVTASLLWLACDITTPQISDCESGITWLNHSGVEECQAINPATWRPVDTTGGGDLIL